MPQTSTGRKLTARGFDGSKADWVLHVCFDTFKFSQPRCNAPCIFVYSPIKAAELARTKPGVAGSREGASEQGTGFGAKLTPKELGAIAISFTPNLEWKEVETGKRAELEVKKFLEGRGWTVRDATRAEQCSQKIDFVASRGDEVLKVEVKSRSETKAFPALFIQTHEANPDKRIS